MKISVVTPTFNEEPNILRLLQCISNLFDRLGLEYEHIIVDNCSTDRTVLLAAEFAKENSRTIKIIKNPVNYGPDYSPLRGFKEATGTIVIPIVADFQDPPELIEKMLKIYSESPNLDAVLCIFNPGETTGFRGYLSIAFYKIMRLISIYREYDYFQGFGLYTRQLVDRMIADPYRFFYFRGLVSKHANRVKTIEYIRPKRNMGKSSYNWLRLVRHAVVAVNSQNPFFFDLLVVLYLLVVIGFNFNAFILLAIVFLKNIYTTE